MNDFQNDDLEQGGEGYAELDRLFAAARQPTAADLGAAQRFLAERALAAPQGAEQPLEIGPSVAQPSSRQRHLPRLWATAVLGVAAAVGGLMVLRPAPAELPASAAYSVYQSALGEGW